MFLLQLLQTPPTYALPLFIHFFSIKTSSLFILKYVSHWVQLVLSTCAKHWGQTLGWAICQRPQLQVCKNESFFHRLPMVPKPGMDPWESLPLPGWELNCLEVVQVMNAPVNSRVPQPWDVQRTLHYTEAPSFLLPFHFSHLAFYDVTSSLQLKGW